ncbi:ABC transporter permease [Desulfosporosinus shakirovi]|uniref:ABC transporter permease n=1 Tax=Desulfosporosinus shakirovi TaxID=2885154 RepID=UPI001E46AA8D|nr:ABC transporter permease [Desulfosporosinus sp. SRJS8]MCB8815903.1 ABC transporter permease [Desulfosporosinus sp. SRJS8]
MLNLIQNENMKIYHQMSTYIMLGLMIVVVIAGGFISTNGGPGQQATTNSDWRTELTEQNTNLQETLKGIQSQGIAVESAQIEKLIKTNNYRLEHNLPPEYGVWGFVTEFSVLVDLVSLFVIIIAAGIVAGEFNTGTIKLLLIRPIKRWKVLLSKYIAVLWFAFVALILLFVATFVVGGIFHSFNGLNQPYLGYKNGNVTEINMLWHIFINYAYACVNLLMMVTFAFMISAVFRNNTLAVGISLFLMFTGNLLVGLLSNYSWVKYILFANINLTVYTDGTPVVKGMTMTFSLMVLAVYFIVFNLISWYVFMKRDVAT